MHARGIRVVTVVGVATSMLTSVVASDVAVPSPVEGSALAADAGRPGVSYCILIQPPRGPSTCGGLPVREWDLAPSPEESPGYWVVTDVRPLESDFGLSYDARWVGALPTVAQDCPYAVLDASGSVLASDPMEVGPSAPVVDDEKVRLSGSGAIAYATMVCPQLF